MLLTVLHLSISTLIFAIGMTATAEDITYLWKRPLLLLKSIITMYVIIPVAAIIMTQLLDLPSRTNLALVVLAICAGAPLLPKKMIKLGGDPSYIFSLIVTTSVLAIATVPASLNLLSTFIPFDTTDVTPMGVAVVILKSFLLPLGAGMVLRWLLPELSNRFSESLLKVAGTTMGICSVIALIAGHRLLLEVGAPTMLAFALFTLVALIAGHLLGGPDLASRSSLAIACASRHIGLALLIAANVKQPETLTLVIAYLLASAIVSTLYVVWIKRLSKHHPQ